MQIHIGLPSRGRPLDMVASAVSLFRLASGAHDVRVNLAIDNDDNDNMHFAGFLWGRTQGQAQVWQNERPLGLGDLHNAMAAHAPEDAAFMLWSDRLHVITPGWDQVLALACMQFPKRVLWLDSVHLQGAGQFILPPAWRAAQGAPCPGLYPAWFEDTAVEEMDAFVHGFPRVAIDAKCAGARKLPTHRLRDLPFWIELFAATRPQRIEDSRRIADALGMKWQPRLQEADYFLKRDRSFLGRAEQLERECGDPGPADETYLAAKARAEAIMTGLRS